ncbi:hypothetical protein [Spartinivicinus poritis]|uniref:Uncharacterized protein n=1 Tax=Spartinivicinus poritis TaxID=2994640 RepID=A0ABT5UAJ2_9GAMM|nr:hypothetical protein [Spartinivicinus sp. A2-2]MDE1463322.1 hypothetical protein [Spartinivicinus sp. A2-2]
MMFSVKDHQNKIYPLEQGLEILNGLLKKKGVQFLPVLINSNLRELIAKKLLALIEIR